MATLKGRLLLGWIPKEKAIQFLLNDCVFDPPLTDAGAEKLWQIYRDRSAALAERLSIPIAQQTMTPDEKLHAASFKNFMNQRRPHNVTDVAKVDISKLVVLQYVIVSERAEAYKTKVNTEKDWRKEVLPTSANPPPGLQYQYTQQQLNMTATFELPHAEFAFMPTLRGHLLLAN